MAMMMAQRPLAINNVWLRWLQLVVYSVLIANGFYYLYLDIEAFSILPVGLGVFVSIQSFSTTIDYSGWLLLMAVLNIRTRRRNPEALDRWQRWALNGFALLGYLVLGFALYLYVTFYYYYDEFAVYPSSEVCGLADDEAYFLNPTQEYQLLTADNCGALSSGEVLRHQSELTLITPENRGLGYWLAVVGVVNAVAWLVLLVVLPLQLWIRQNWPSRGKILWAIDGFKGLLYAILLVNAVCWLIYGTWVDALDGFLWLIAILSLEWVSRRSTPASA